MYSQLRIAYVIYHAHSPHHHHVAYCIDCHYAMKSSAVTMQTPL